MENVLIFKQPRRSTSDTTTEFNLAPRQCEKITPQGTDPLQLGEIISEGRRIKISAAVVTTGNISEIYHRPQSCIVRPDRNGVRWGRVTIHFRYSEGDLIGLDLTPPNKSLELIYRTPKGFIHHHIQNGV